MDRLQWGITGMKPSPQEPDAKPAARGKPPNPKLKAFAAFLAVAAIPPLLSFGFDLARIEAFSVKSVNPISHPLTLAVYGFFGWQLGKSRLPDLSALPRHRVRAAARPIPYLRSRWLWPLAAGGTLAFVGGIWQAVARLL